MKRTPMLISILLLMMSAYVCKAQDTGNFFSFFVKVTNAGFLPTVQYQPGQEPQLNFPNGMLNEIAMPYHFRQFTKAFPNSTDPAKDNVYLVEVNDPNFMYELSAFDSVVFDSAYAADFRSFFVTITDPQFVPTTQYQDFQTSVSFIDPNVNQLASGYTFKAFQKAFPNSLDHPNDYFVTVNSLDFMTALSTLNGNIFYQPYEAVFKRFYLSVTDRNYTPVTIVNLLNQKSYSFMQSGLNTTVSNYFINCFSQAFPFSNLEHLRNLYYVEASSTQLIQDLKNFNSSVFPRGFELQDIELLSVPNDYNLTAEHALQLDLINAQAAWDITQGDPDLIIGMTDGYVNSDHRDLKKKDASNKDVSKVNNTGNANLSAFINNPQDIHDKKEGHGAAVSGLIVGNIDNATGICGIAPKCQIVNASFGKSHIVTNYNKTPTYPDIMMANMSSLRPTGGRLKVLNASWSYGDDAGATGCIKASEWKNAASPLWNRFRPHQDIYNEIYENGTVAVFGAGNGNLDSDIPPDNICETSGYRFPASFDHNISVSAVGIYPGGNSSLNSYKDEHMKDHSTSLSANHNDRVDLVAPGYSMTTLWNTSSTTAPIVKSGQDGTSFSAPLVTGTVALMMHANYLKAISKNPKADYCLTPYQIECILKNTATDVYPKNTGFASGKELGKGRLNTGAAVAAARDYNCNNPDTKTLIIESVEVSHKCISAQTKPQLKLIIKNGDQNATYDYRWMDLDKNDVTLSDYFIANPTIKLGGTKAYFLVTITEKNKDIPRVASKRVKIDLMTSGWDLGMRDGVMDMYNEPNDMDAVDVRDWNYWESPDIWNRKNLSSPVSPVHENPEYKTQDPNYLYVRIKNVGCATSPAGKELKLYWTKGGTAELWATDWINGSNANPPTGQEIIPPNPILIPALTMGQEYIAMTEWHPPLPQTYTGVVGSEMAVCVLARLLNSNTAPYGLNETPTSPKPDPVKMNVVNNNNIITRNLVVTDEKSGNTTKVKYFFDFSNGDGIAQTSVLEVVTDKHIHPHYSGDMSAYLYATLYLGDLYDIWKNGGGVGTGIQYDDATKTVVFDPATPLRLENIQLPVGASYPIAIDFTVRDNISIPYPIVDDRIHVRQMVTRTEIFREEVIQHEEVAGNISFAINLEADQDANPAKPGREQTQQVMENGGYKVYPNPVGNMLTISTTYTDDAMALVQVLDVTGRVVSQQQNVSFKDKKHTINTSQLMPGIYFLNLVDNAGTKLSFKFVKTN